MSDALSLFRYIDPLGLVIVVGGSFAAAAFGSTGRDLRSAVAALGSLGRNSFDAATARAEIARLDRVARRHGLLAIEAEPVSDKALADAVRALVDGGGATDIEATFVRSRDERMRARAAAPRFWGAVADVAPGAGLVGTVGGLVTMFAHLDDLATVGPAMALALLTTLYGAVLANLIAAPIAHRLTRLAETEEEARLLVEPHVVDLARLTPTRRRTQPAAAA